MRLFFMTIHVRGFVMMIHSNGKWNQVVVNFHLHFNLCEFNLGVHNIKSVLEIWYYPLHNFR